jgi:hypothetical protein
MNVGSYLGLVAVVVLGSGGVACVPAEGIGAGPSSSEIGKASSAITVGIPYALVNRYSMKCVNDTNSSTANGTKMSQLDCSAGTSPQKWTFIDNGSGWYQIKNTTSGKCLDDTNGALTDGNQIQQWTCAAIGATASQMWMLQVQGQWNQIVNKTSSKCLSGDDKNNSTILTQRTCLATSFKQHLMATVINTSFTHPGVVTSQGQITYLKANINNAPYAAAYAAMVADSHAGLTYTFHPPTSSNGYVVQCGPNSIPDVHCLDEKDDATAAYADALAWTLTGDTARRDKAIAILNAWSVLNNHTDANAVLQAGWMGGVFARAAELMRYTASGWSSTSITSFENMLKRAFVPLIQNGSGSYNGNWETATIDSLMQISVFVNDRSLFNKAVSLWTGRAANYVYLISDGAHPIANPWGFPSGNNSGYCNPSTSTCDIDGYYGQTTRMMVDGFGQEFCRDLEHTQMGIGSLFNAGETARLQGFPLFQRDSVRLAAAMELLAKYLNSAPGGTITPPSTLQTSDTYLCQNGLLTLVGAASHATVNVQPGWEIAYNEFVNRDGISMPLTTTLINANRPLGFSVTRHMAWETLTHAGVGLNGVP